MHHCPNTPWILVGNKSDLKEDQDVVNRLSEKRLTPISYSQAMEMANSLGAVTYVSSLLYLLSFMPCLFSFSYYLPPSAQYLLM